MLEISARSPRNGVADAIRSMRDVPARVLPIAASTALTRVARRLATQDLPAEMQRVFDRPVRYTLNSLRVQPATRQTLSARVFVKDDAPNNGTRPEDYLLPQVEGGGRNEKRFERAMRYAGLLPSGWRAIPGSGALLDGSGNLKRGEIQRILTATRSATDVAQRKTDSKRSRRNARNAPYFAITPTTGSFVGGEYKETASRLIPGVYRRDGNGIKPVLIFTKRQPQYRQRLNFTAVAERVTLEQFPMELNRAVTDLLNRRR
ncbi:MAG: hypothetical protein ACK40L_12735 [Hydrogenophaga sp.]